MDWIKTFALKLGYELKRYRPLKSSDGILQHLLNEHKITTLLDIGANRGQYAEKRRRYGYNGQIISFEPSNEVFQILKKRAKDDPLWETPKPLAISKTSGRVALRISPSSDMSSLLEFTSEASSQFKGDQFEGTQMVESQTLAEVLKLYKKGNERVFVKIDTQGSEMEILESAGSSLKEICGFQLELSILPTYEGESLYSEIIPFLNQYGFELVHLIPGYFSPKQKRMLQFDGIFFRV